MTYKQWTQAEIKRALNIPHRHALRVYIRLVAIFHGDHEPDEGEIDEIVSSNENDLLGAIKCFRSVIAGHEERLAKEMADRREAARPQQVWDRRGRSLLNPIKIKPVDHG